MATRYRADYFIDGGWQEYGIYTTMTEAECVLLMEGFEHTRVVAVEDLTK